MTNSNRRDFLRNVASATAAGFGTTLLPPVIRRALAIPPHRRAGSIADVEHVVILMQENRSFDHYFGTLRGMRGFGDRFPIPVPDAPGIQDKTVWYQATGSAAPAVVVPFRLNTGVSFEFMRVEGTPHSWPDAQHAWADGKLNEWPRFKQNHSLGYFGRQDIPFQFAMAEAFTLCDAYHCSFHGGTNTNRLFLWTGTNDPLQEGNGPAIDNSYDNLEHDPAGGYTWITYSERLEAAGIRWQVYQNMADNFTDNPLAGFRSYRDAYGGLPGALAVLAERGLATRDLDLLKQDVLEGTLPAVSWVVATAEGSEHPGPSSPAQGADYTAKVLDALTSNPDVWSKTVLLVNFDENDGFFDHMPPPAAPSFSDDAHEQLTGDSSVDTTGEYHLYLAPDVDAEGEALQFKPYGMGPRVPLYVISPWSRGGWVNSQVFDHTSIIRFLERRFGVREPNISEWRRAVAGDLTSAFDFADPDNENFFEELPETTALADRARALPGRVTPPDPGSPELPVQEVGSRLSRALPYELHVHARVRQDRIELSFVNSGRAGAVFHVYDKKHLTRVPRRYTVDARHRLSGVWELSEKQTAYDLWVLGPNGFHRHFTGEAIPEERHACRPEIEVSYHAEQGDVAVKLSNGGRLPCSFELTPNAYYQACELATVGPQKSLVHRWSLRRSANWYDFTVKVPILPGFARRFAGRVETGRDSFSDPALGGPALGER